jgi:hypothetical protein
MGTSPTRLLIEPLLITSHTVPTKIMRPVVRAQGLDDLGGFAITVLATMVFEVFYSH